MPQDIRPTGAALQAALVLSEEILRDIELAQLPLSNIALKSARLARLLNDFPYQKLFQYEASGYPSTSEGLSPETWTLAVLAGRTYQRIDDKGQTQSYAFLESIEQLEAQIRTATIRLEAARDPNISISSANPNQWIHSNPGNALERNQLQQQISEAAQRLGSRRLCLHAYVARRNLELKFSGIASDAFSRIRRFVDESIGTIVPSALQKFNAIYENLQSENPEDWSNAVHSCRRVLQDLADVLFPATDEPRTIESHGKQITVELGPERYINRLVCFAKDMSTSRRSAEIIGSHLAFLGDRLDALFHAAQKGSHSVISSRDEADRYVVYTYMLVGDLLRLKSNAMDGQSGSVFDTTQGQASNDG
ncbi:MAG: hypothetical protein AB1664_14140 [Thermodesulfobacteriota bacterium]